MTQLDPERVLWMACAIAAIALFWLSILLVADIRWGRVAVRVRRWYINLDHDNKTFLRWWGRAWYVAAMLLAARI